MGVPPTPTTVIRSIVRAVALVVVAATASFAQSDLPLRGAAGVAIVGLAPRGEFANNVNSAWGLAGHGLFRLDQQGVVALRAELSYMVYGAEHYRVPLGAGPLGLINIDVNTTNNIINGGLGLQVVTPGVTVRPYGVATIGFSYFFTASSAEGSNNTEPFASSTNYSDGGLAWTVGGGLYVPVYVKRSPVNLDLGVRWVDNGRREYLRPDGITFGDQGVSMHPVRSDAKGVQFSLGVTWVFRY